MSIISAGISTIRCNFISSRPYFTYWISFVQVIVLIVGLSVYGFAPIGFTETEEKRLVSLFKNVFFHGTVLIDEYFVVINFSWVSLV